MKNTLITLLLATGMVATSSCQNYGTAAQNDAATGALIGAAAGGLIGKDSKRSRQGALLGAAVGGATGYAVGKQKDDNARRY